MVRVLVRSSAPDAARFGESYSGSLKYQRWPSGSSTV